MASRLLSLAFFLPQFHRIPENDAWWGEGFTEWTQLGRWQPWFKGHRIREPVLPLGRYSLLDPHALEAQSTLARAHGIDAFLIWDYWFGQGSTLLERPAAMILERNLDVPYTLAWANHDWVDKRGRRLLMKQHYLGEPDYEAYFLRCLPHFRSERYIKVGGKPLFFLYRPAQMPDLPVFLQTWRRLAQSHGLPGLYLIGDLPDVKAPDLVGFDACSSTTGLWANRPLLRRPDHLLQTALRRFGAQTAPLRFDYAQLTRGVPTTEARRSLLHTVFTGWDTTPRYGRNGIVVEGLNEASFAAHLLEVRQQLQKSANESTPKVVLVKSWNEWAEGNLLEPDSVHGTRLLQRYRDFANAVNAD